MKPALDFLAMLPDIQLQNCYIGNLEKDFYSIIYKSEKFTFMLILEHDIHNKEFYKISLNELHKEKINFSMYGFLISNQSTRGVQSFKNMMTVSPTGDILNDLKLWSIFKVNNIDSKIEIKKPSTQLLTQIENIISDNSIEFL